MSKNKLLESLKSGNVDEIKNALNERLSEKLHEQISSDKLQIAEDILTTEKEEIEDDDNISEDVIDDTQASDLPTDKLTHSTELARIVKTRLDGNGYRYSVPFKNRIYVVEFHPIDSSNMKYNAYFYAKGFQKDPKFSVHFGIGAISNISPVFKNVLRTIEQFLETRKPQMIRFIPGEGAAFPSIFHQNIYSDLKEFEKSLDKKYSITRGDAIKDGSAFVLKRGGSQTSLRSKSWKPSEATPKENEVELHKKGGEVDEEIANVSGANVATDRPVKPPLGFPGLAKQSVKDNEKIYSAMERRKENK